MKPIVYLINFAHLKNSTNHIFNNMSQDIRIKKGLDLKLKGEAELSTASASRSKVYAIKPFDFHGVIPKMEVKEGNTVKAGEVIFYSKANPEIKFVSP